MPPKVLTEKHQWVYSAFVPVSEKQAKYAARRDNFYIDRPLTVDVLDVRCDQCRQPAEQVADQPCVAYVDNRHLIGGRPDGSRKRMPKATGTEDEPVIIGDDEDDVRVSV